MGTYFTVLDNADIICIFQHCHCEYYANPFNICPTQKFSIFTYFVALSISKYHNSFIYMYSEFIEKLPSESGKLTEWELTKWELMKWE